MLFRSVGIIIAAIFLSGLGNKLSSFIVAASGENLFLAIILVIIACIILGMGLPPTASYIMVAVMAAPSLARMGVPLLTAHLAVFWFSQLSNVTPPVCLAAFSAASISGSDPMKTGFSALRTASLLLLLPVIFIYNPQLMLIGSTMEIIQAVITALIGTVFYATAMIGYWLRPAKLWERILLFVVAFALIWPGYVSDILGIVSIIVVTISQLKRPKAQIYN